MKSKSIIIIVLFLASMFFFCCKNNQNTSGKSIAEIKIKLDSLLDSKKAEDTIAVKKELQKLLESDDEHEVLLTGDYYYKLNDTVQINLVQKTALKRFPKGLQARLLAYQLAYDIKSISEQEKKYNAFLQQFPVEKFMIKDRNIYNLFLLNMAIKHIEKNQLKEAEQKMNRFVKEPFLALVYYNFATALYNSKFIEESIHYLNQSTKTAKEVFKEGKIDAADKEIVCNIHNDALRFHAIILYDQKKFAESISYFESYEKQITFSDNEAASMHVNSLLAVGNKTAAYTLLEKIVKTNHAKIEELTLFKSLFLEVKGNQNDFKQYQVALEKELQLVLKEEVATSIIKEKAPDFTLMGMNGKKITSASLRGKVLVVDFWATWCHPCISSFKAAKQVKDTYKNNPNVQFLFANVFEQGSAAEIKKKVVEFSHTSGYDFDFYLTSKDEKTPELNVARLFDVTNIPVKVLIDKEGYIRYKIIGYDGNDKVEKDKLVSMIEVVLNQ